MDTSKQELKRIDENLTDEGLGPGGGVYAGRSKVTLTP
jgi:hypothetical protein